MEQKTRSLKVEAKGRVMQEETVGFVGAGDPSSRSGGENSAEQFSFPVKGEEGAKDPFTVITSVPPCTILLAHIVVDSHFGNVRISWQEPYSTRTKKGELPDPDLSMARDIFHLSSPNAMSNNTTV